MAKVSIVTRGKARASGLPPGFAGTACAEAYFDGARDPLHLHLHRIAPDGELAIGPLASDCAVFVWHGDIAVGGVALVAGSSAIAERGASLTLAGGRAEALVLCFAGAARPANARAGGAVHLLPADRVPRLAAEAGTSGVSGALHADSSCPTCAVWLHENHFPGGPALSSEQAALGIHSHTEDEIIFVTAGSMRLGARLVGPGTALAIATDTLYSFRPGPEGLSFVNFRAAMPGDIRFAHGASISETGYWRERVARPAYLSPLAA